MKLYGARLVEVPMDAEGLIPEKLEEAVRQYRPKLLYTVPNFQNPTGVTLSQARRKAVAALAARYQFLHRRGRPLPRPALRGHASARPSSPLTRKRAWYT